MNSMVPLAWLSLLLLAAPAEAEGECKLPLHLWELDLTKVELVSGNTADLNAIGRALGTRALLRGGYQDPAHPKVPAHATLVGSTDGIGFRLTAEKTEP